MIFRKWREQRIINKYLDIAVAVGDMISYVPTMGECIGFSRYVNLWEKAEIKYAKLGYRTISVDDLINAGGYGYDISHLVKVKRNSGENPIFHSTLYKEYYLGKIMPALDMNSIMTGDIQFGTFTMPSTEDLINARNGS